MLQLIEIRMTFASLQEMARELGLTAIERAVVVTATDPAAAAAKADDATLAEAREMVEVAKEAVAAEEPAPKKRRKRRSKAEIEAAKAAENEPEYADVEPPADEPKSDPAEGLILSTSAGSAPPITQVEFHALCIKASEVVGQEPLAEVLQSFGFKMVRDVTEDLRPAVAQAILDATKKLDPEGFAKAGL